MFSMLHFGNLNLRMHEELHPLHLQVPCKCHAMLPQFHHLLLLGALNPIIDLLNFIITCTNSLTGLSEGDDDLLPLLCFSSAPSLGKLSVTSMELKDIELKPLIRALGGKGRRQRRRLGLGLQMGLQMEMEMI
jgi:hypothetical protein